MYFLKINLCSKLLPKVIEIMRLNYSREERQKIVEEYIQKVHARRGFAETENDWEKLLPWNIEITPYKIRGEWI